ncbi:MAG: AraC family transcriptional regulator [Gemmatimonadota bacterium]
MIDPRSLAPAQGHLVLPFGAFYGSVERRLRGDGMELALLDVDPHRVVERHSHDEAHFVFVLDGLYLSSARHAPPVSAGPALIFNPAGTTHRDRFEARGKVMSGRFLTLSLASALMAGAEDDGGAMPEALAIPAPEAIVIAERLVRALPDAGTDGTLRRESLALALLAKVRPAPRRTSAGGAPAWLARARALLDESLGGVVSIADVAREAGVHPVHLARVFRKQLGATPGEYLRQRRLSHACTLLRDTRRPPAEIAQACGFVDQSHFATAFRRAFGVTPGTYRRR